MYSHFIYHFYIADSQLDCSCLDFSPPHSWNFTCVLYIAIGVAKGNFNSTCLKTIFFFYFCSLSCPVPPSLNPWAICDSLFPSASVRLGSKVCHFTFKTSASLLFPLPADVPFLQALLSQELSSLSPFPDFFHSAVHLLENCLCCLSKVCA